MLKWTLTCWYLFELLLFIVVRSLSCAWFLATPWIAAHHASLSFTISGSLLKLTSTESVMPSSYLIPCHPLLLLPSIFPPSGSFPVSQLFTSCGQSTRASASASILPKNIQDWFPLGSTGLISLLSKGLSRVFCSIQFKSIDSSKLSLLYGPTLTSIRDYWKNHSFDYMDLCQQTDIFSF